MKRLLLKKSRKLILLLLLGFRYIIMKVCIVNMMVDSSFIEAALIVGTTTAATTAIKIESISGALSRPSNSTSYINTPFIQTLNRFISKSQENENINSYNKNNSSTDSKEENTRSIINSINSNNLKGSIAEIQYKKKSLFSSTVKRQDADIEQYKHNSLRYQREVDETRTLVNDSTFKRGEYEEQQAIVVMMKHEDDNRKMDVRKWWGEENGYDNTSSVTYDQSDDEYNEAGIQYDDIDGGEENHREYNIDSDKEEMNNRYAAVATTPKINDWKPTSNERHNDDYESQYDNDSNDKSINLNSKSFFDAAKKLLDIFLAANTAWNTFEAKQQIQNQIKNNENNEANKGNLRGNLSSTSHQDQINDEERSRRDSFYSEIGMFPRDYNTSTFSWLSSSISQTPPITTETTELSIVEGRYIKGDPLKGYYDFVITEGSYKFWAGFQLATAVLIIYSTFAAIYYSKVNPLVGDYDYVDYLGGGRSLSDDTNNVEFVDTKYDASKSSSREQVGTMTTFTSTLSSIFNRDWIPRTKHTIQFILDAIDKIPPSQ